jgi:hypothetical protein
LGSLVDVDVDVDVDAVVVASIKNICLREPLIALPKKALSALERKQKVLGGPWHYSRNCMRNLESQ